MAERQKRGKLRHTQPRTLFEVARFKFENGRAATHQDFARVMRVDKQIVFTRLGRLKPYLMKRRGFVAIDGQRVVDRPETAAFLMSFVDAKKNADRSQLTRLAAKHKIAADRVPTLFEMLLRHHYHSEVPGWEGLYEVGPSTENEIDYLRMLAKLVKKRPRR